MQRHIGSCSNSAVDGLELELDPAGGRLLYRIPGLTSVGKGTEPGSCYSVRLSEFGTFSCGVPLDTQTKLMAQDC